MPLKVVKLRLAILQALFEVALNLPHAFELIGSLVTEITHAVDFTRPHVSWLSITKRTVRPGASAAAPAAHRRRTPRGGERRLYFFLSTFRVRERS